MKVDLGIHRFRIKTEKEMIADFGENWRDEIDLGWCEEMDWYIGRTIPKCHHFECLRTYMGVQDDFIMSRNYNAWYIGSHMIKVITKMKTLDQIGLNYRTDKSSPYHNYLVTYEQYFEKFRDQFIQVWELGIGDITSENREGESGLMWRDYFTNGQISVFDNDPVKVERWSLKKHGISAYLADQTDKTRFENLVTRYGRPTIIIDDASHIQKNTIQSFENLFPLLQSGGLYCLEDVVTSYWPDWGGNIDYYDNSNTTIMSYMLDLCHLVNFKRQETFNPPQNRLIPDFIKEIDSIHFHHSQIIIKKK